MSERVTMPALGESVTEGTVTRWLKNVGDSVEVDEPLLEVSTDKVDTEIPSPVAGTLEEILVQEDDTVPVGADLAVIGDGSGGGGSDSGSDQADQQSGDSGDSGEAQEQQAEPEPEAPSTEQAEAPATSEPEQAESGDSGPSDSGSSGSGGSGGGGEGTTVQMPALGESVTEGTVTRWLKAEGDEVAVDEPLLEVSTDKVDTEIPSPVAGTLTKILVSEDDTVPVGGDLAVIGGGGDDAPARVTPAEDKVEEHADIKKPAPSEEDAQQSQPDQGQQDPGSQESTQESAPEQPSQPTEQPPAQAPAAEQSSEPAKAEQQATSGDSGGSAPAGDASAYVTPLVRKLASDHGVDLGSLTGTGVGGRIRKQDVLDAAEKAKAAAAEPAPAEPAPAAAAAPSAPAATSRPSAEASAKRGTTEKMSRLRRTIAKRMVESLQTSAQLTTVVEVDVTKIARLRARAKGDFETREGVKLSFLPFFALAAVEALKVYPTVNSSVDGDEVTYHGTENLGIAVDTEKGLIVPVVKNAGDLNIAGLARAIADVANRTRTNKIMPDDLAGGTFTLTNTGSRGALFDTPIINQPQVGILGTGAVVKRPIVVADPDGGETIAIRSMVYLALSYDHRVVDGADAARFLTAMKARLEEGAFEV